ncbi:SOS response-associated peptidase [Coralliovum pocilloporae]|uniref:SOS response-associated peptidase n=1 Tax=Coralliovum pocilloporae TaxID=3066369 RepID=UPI003306F82E
MCGRYALNSELFEVQQAFKVDEQPQWAARYNITPTQPAFIVHRQSQERTGQLVRWGFVPSWAKDPAAMSLIINARSETLEEKPSFRAAYKHRRCLVPATGFYEWQRSGKTKTPYWVPPAGGGLIAFAGIWETWSDAAGTEMDTMAILTTEANATLAAIHHRQPVVIHPDQFDAWLGIDPVSPSELKEMTRPAPDDFFAPVRVGERINKAIHDDADLQKPLSTEDIAKADAAVQEQFSLF